MRSHRRLLAIIGTITLTAAASGCAYFRSGEVTTTPWPPPNSSSGNPTINLVVSGNIAGELLQKFSSNTLRAYQDSGLFAQVRQSARQSEGLTAEIVVAHSGDSNPLYA